MKKIIFILCFSFVFVPSLAWAGTKEIISEGTYNMGDGETPMDAEAQALLQAKRGAMEQAGTYIESYTKLKNLQLAEDEIQVIATGVIEIEVLDKKRAIVGDGINFWVKIKARVSTDRIEEMAKRVREKNVIEVYRKEILEVYDEVRRVREALKGQLKEAKSEAEKKQIKANITDKERLAQAIVWFDKGYKYYLNNEHAAAIEAYTSAIAINPNYGYAYNNRGIAYYYKGQYDRAIEDYNRAIAINPNCRHAYNNRGIAYYYKGQYDRAIEDYNRTIAINPNCRHAYNNRGIAYDSKGQYDRAIEDYNKAIVLNPNLAYAYNNRGTAYNNKGHYDRAIEDYNKAIALNPTAKTYTNRGLAYSELGNLGRAISDFQKACDVGDKDGCKELQKVLQNR